MAETDRENDAIRENLSPQEEMRTWQKQLIRGMLRAMIVAGLLAAAAGTYDSLESGDLWTLPIYWGSWGIVVLLAFWRRAPYALQVGALIGMLYFIGFADFIQDGSTGSARAFMLAVPFLAGLFLERRESILALLLSTLTMGGFGWAFLTGRIVIPGDTYSTDAGGWVAGTLSDDGFPVLRTPFEGAESIELDMGVTYVSGAWQNEGQTATQFGYGSYTTFSNADGNGEGGVLDFSISTDGIIRANFDNGVISDLYRVALSDFINPYGIRRMGSSLYQADPSGSGNLITGSPGSSGLGMITGSSLERSNVDLTEQFGELIFTQRAYQANAKGIVAADEMLKTLVALKR